METPFLTSYLDCSQIGQSVLETGKVINIFEKTVCSDEKRFALLRFLTGLYPFLSPPPLFITPREHLSGRSKCNALERFLYS